ncbi:MAG: bifunctional phosphoribosyl-AMP cyclohydrolase/phosphoribosyl-ATP diphosphatase HisIE [Candidatus Atribacteria bacterium]|nr:bifunctional phosphoribosyl-AMP cyclohydrolase/phosphoribosyl-ATP diphosphatase HisIE [Candidatus Atribacteria bacterium]
MMKPIIENINFDDQGLIPAIIQEEKSGKVLMMAYMNSEALEKTITTGKTWFYSRKRKTLWNKGETSGHYQLVKAIYLDCDQDTLLITVEQKGVACHTGRYSCFHRQVLEGDITLPQPDLPPYPLAAFTQELFDIIQERAKNPSPQSYTSQLLELGREKIVRKVAEETTEVILASLENSEQKREHLQWEVADLLYHLLVLIQFEKFNWYDIMNELKKRRK